MIVLITLIYLGCVYAAFKVIKLEVKPASVAVAAFIGVYVLGGVVIGWNFAAPMVDKMTVTRPVIPLLASQNTKEVITKIHVEREQAVKKGDLLYELETAPFQYTVERRTAQLAEARKNLVALESSVASAEATIEQTRALRENARVQLEVTSGMRADDIGAASELQLTTEQLSYVSADAAVKMAVASHVAAGHALASAREAIKVTEASLETAQLELDRVYIRAPADGHVINWQATTGTMATTLITSAQGTFQDMSETSVVAILRENLLKNVKPGEEVEIAFQNFPGQLAMGKVDALLGFTGEGQLSTSGVVPVAASLGSKGFLAVRIKLDDEQFARELPLGAAGTTAIYTDFGKPFHAITKIAIRMKSWLYMAPF